MQSEVADELLKSLYKEGIRNLWGARKATVSCIKKEDTWDFGTGKSHQICQPISLELVEECSLQST